MRNDRASTESRLLERDSAARTRSLSIFPPENPPWYHRSHFSPLRPPSPLLTKNNSSEVFVLFANGESEESFDSSGIKQQKEENGKDFKVVL